MLAAHMPMPKRDRLPHCPLHDFVQAVRLDPAAMLAESNLRREIIEVGIESPQDLPGEVTLGGQGPDHVS